MNEKGGKRKLTAIMSADVVGYSRLMEDDEETTVSTITEYREVIVSSVEKHGGRVVDAKGDNVLAEFPSALNAVRSAVDIQNELGKRNYELPSHRKMQFRIGVNLGDVIEDGGTIYGDGVNIAARLEGLAKIGGVCISGKVFEEVKRKPDLGFKDLGEHAVKNISEPIRAYAVLTKPKYVGKVIGERKSGLKRWQRAALAVLVGLILLSGGFSVWNYLFRPPDAEPASEEKMAFPLPDKPSIAVLPFDNLSEDPAQENIVDGITDAIITGLSKTPELFVIARNSVLTYKGKPVKVKQVSEELGVRYVLEGSVQKTGDKSRINAQLIDAIKGHHLWAEKYDRDLKDLFALQDDITMKIITELQVNLTDGEYARVVAKGTDNLEAYLKCRNAIQIFRRITKEDNLNSRKMFAEVMALDPKYPRPYLYIGFTHYVDGMFGWSKSREQSLARAEEFARKALELDDSMGMPHRLLGDIYRVRKQWEKCIAESELAVSKDPNTLAMYGVAMNLNYAGRHEEAIAWYEKALRLDPIPPALYISLSGNAYFDAERYEEALVQFKRALERKGEYNPIQIHSYIAATYAMLGQEEEAQNHSKEVLRINPKYSLKREAETWGRSYKNQAVIDRWIDACRKAGLPD